MNADTRVMSIYEQASALSAEGRAVFLNEACADEALLRRRVERLLAAEDRVDDFLDASPSADASALWEALPPHGLEDTPKAVEDETAIPAGTELAQRYRVVEPIGTGGMGRVYHAHDLRLGREVAVKVLHHHRLSDPEMRQRFEREIKSVALLSHPNVVTLYDLDFHDDTPFAIMERVTGETLRKLIGNSLDWREAVGIARDVAAGLDAAHQRGLMHRDIKPENVIRSDEGPAKILDFGLARREVLPTDQALTSPSLTPGTVPYMSPEQAESQPLTCATDVFSLGTVLYEMLTGTNPFRDESPLATMQRVNDAQPRPLAQAVEHLPGALILLVEAMLQRSPERRPAAAEVRTQLEDLLDHAPSVERSQSISTPDASPLGANGPFTNLPIRHAGLIGRDAEHTAVVEFLRQDKLITLVGPGGVGKTSLAVAVGREVLSDFPGGVWFCELAAVREDQQVLAAAAGVVGPACGAPGPIDTPAQFAERLPDESMILVLDNCEHVINGAAKLAESLLSLAPHLTVLATSREPLEVSGERVRRLVGLPYTDAMSSAAELFIRRAEAVSSFRDTPAQRPLVNQIVTRLEGLPLAIELAASRLVAMSPEELLDALGDQMQALRSGRRAQNRHGTIENTIAWSFDLLGPAEQQLLLDLSVFVGPFNSEAATAVGGLPQETALLLHRLVEQSVLVHTNTDGRSRYRLLEPIRQFCQRRIEAEKSEAAQERHARWYAGRAVVLGRGVYGENETRCAKSLDAEWPDLRQAIAWGREHNVTEIAIDPLVALDRTVWMQARVEAYNWLYAAEQQFGDEVARRPEVLSMLATAKWFEGSAEQAQAYLSRSLELEPTTAGLYMQYMALSMSGDTDQAVAVVEQARRLAESLDDESASHWWSLPLIASVLTMSNPQDPRIDADLIAAERRVAEQDWPTGRAFLSMVAGNVAGQRGDFSSAARYLDQALAQARIGENKAIATTVGMMKGGLAESGDKPLVRLKSAVDSLRLLIDSGSESGNASVYPLAIRALVIALADCKRWETAGRCVGLISSLRGVGHADEMTPGFPSAIENIHAALGQEGFSLLKSQGQKMTLAEVAQSVEQDLVVSGAGA